MYEDHLLNKPDTDGFIVPIFWESHNDTELVAEVFKTLVASVKIVHLVTAKQEFHSIRQKRVIVVLHHNTLEDFFI